MDNFPTPSAMETATDGYAIVPDDEVDLSPKPQLIWVGTGGDVAVEVPSGTLTFTNVPDGVYLRIRAIKVLEATTAQDLVALY